MKCIYRPHRGGLKESIDEKKIFDSVFAMKEYLLTPKDGYPKIEAISIAIIEDDERVGWRFVRVVYGHFKDKEEDNTLRMYILGYMAHEWEGKYE